MAKTLKAFRQDAAKLKELVPPKDATASTKQFVRKHVYVVHDDPNGNGDDVFKATNIKPSPRSPDHGYEPGEDEDIYEEVNMTEGAYKALSMSPVHKNANDWSSKVHRKHGSDVRYSTDEKKEYTVARNTENDVVGVFEHKTNRGFIKEEEIVESLGLAAIMLASAFGRTPKNKTDLDEVAFNFGAAVTQPLRAKRQSMGSYEARKLARKDNNKLEKIRAQTAKLKADTAKNLAKAGSPSNDKTATFLKRFMGYESVETPVEEGLLRRKKTLHLTPDMQDPEQKKQLADLDAKIGRKAEYDHQMARQRYIKKLRGEEVELDEMTNYEGFDHFHESVHKSISHLQKTLGVNTDFVHSHCEQNNTTPDMTHVNALRNLHRAIEDAHVQYGRELQHAYPAVRDFNDTPNYGATASPAVKAYEGFDGYEHLESLDEVAQELLVGLYQSLDEENKEQFLEIADTVEGVDQLLDFALTNRELV